MRHARLPLLLLLAAACSERAPLDPAAARLAAAESEIDTRLGLSRDAKREIWKTMRSDMIAPRHPSDGGGRAWIEAVEDAGGERIALHAADRARIRLGYEAGPLGIAKGGALEFRVSPWWRWDPPQPLDRNAPGFTKATVPSGRTRYAWDGDKLSIRFPDGLSPGQRVALVYGAGPALAAVDSYAERGERLWFGVDGDGDGVLAYLADSPRVDIAAGPPANLRVVLPTTARPGEEVLLHVSVLDAYGNTGIPCTGQVRVRAGTGLALPRAIPFEARDDGRRSVSAHVAVAGIFRVTASASFPGVGQLTATSNPLVVESGAPRLYWADLHGHSQLSDGTSTPEQYFTYARDVAGLDAAALTDHDHFGIRFLDQTPEYWQQIRAAVAAFDAPGRFVTVLGYEWTSLLHGHRHVLYFEDDGPVFSSFDPRYQTPTQLWNALRGQPALTFAHHSAGGPISTNWRYRPDPVLEPVTEIVSVHGSSEAADAPIPIYDPVAGNFVRDVLDDGVRLGFIGSGDSHDGHPGANHFGSQRSFGLAAIRADELTRDAIRAALQARRVYATNGARILLELSLDGAPMGSAIPAGETATPVADAMLRMRVVAEAPLERVDLVTRGGVDSLPLAGELEWRSERPVARLRAGEYLYARVVQRDGGAAWSSPIFAE
jgi:hypothetical protein